MTHYDVVKKLIGKIEPVGQSSEDEIRFTNLEKMCLLVDKLLYDINQVAIHNKDSHEHSVRKAGEYAQNQLKEIGDAFQNK